MLRNIKFFVENQLRYSRYFYKKLREVNEQRRWKEGALRQAQERRLVALVQHAYQKSSFYRRFYDKHQVDIYQVKGLSDLARLPIVTKDDVRAHLNGIFVGNRFNRSKAYTSGTTGSPLVLYRDYQSTVREAAYQWSHRMQFGYEAGMRTVTLRGNLGKSEMESYDPYSNTLYLSSYNLSQDNAEWYYQRIRAFGPQAILAYPSALEMLANYFQGMDKSLYVPLAFTSSESLYDYQREKIEEVFSTHVWDWYGNAERTIALEQNQDGRYNELPLYSVNEFQEDHAITTGLINFNFPLIRYKVEDVFTFADTPSQRYRVIERIQGRKYDFVLLPDGTRVVSFGRALKGIRHLLFTQIVQQEIDSFSVNIVTDPNFTPGDEAQIRRNIVDLVGENAVFDIVYIKEEDIIRSNSGKFKLVLNQIPEQSLFELT